jgi:formylglycine-generating enzyme required for sulfatase activity
MRALAAVALVIIVSCGPSKRPQLILFVDTDAPVGVIDANAPLDQPIPLFDRLRIEVLPCDACANEFDVSREQFLAKTVSIGIPRVEPGHRVRIRLFRDLFVRAGEPDPSTTIDRTFDLPTVDGVLDVTANLDADGIGAPSTGALATDAPVESRVGKWARAQRTPCKGALAPDEACVPGGAFFMGAAPGPALETTSWHRVAVISPFRVKTTEVTVAQLAASTIAPSIPWSGSKTGMTFADFCTGTRTPDADHAPLPVNCMTWDDAHAFCVQMNGELPTEAQLAYLASGLRGLPFVWGLDPPQCLDAVWGRNGYGTTAGGEPSICRLPDDALYPSGPDKPGWGARDKLAVGERTIVDLAGNLAEWTRDRYEERTSDCWSPSLLVDPICTAGNQAVLALGGWSLGIESMLAWSRDHYGPSTASPTFGFRCVRPSE